MGLWLSFWLHQGRIPHRTCRFYCCLAAHQRTRKKDSAEPSFPILWTPPHPPGDVRCGGAYLLPRAYTNLGSCIQVLSLLASSECCATICVRAMVVRVSVGLLGLYRSFFIIGGIGCSCLRLRGVLLCSFVGFALTAIGSFIFADTGVGYVFRHRFILYGIPVFLKFQPHERIFSTFFHPAQLVKWACTQQYWKKWRGQR